MSGAMSVQPDPGFWRALRVREAMAQSKQRSEVKTARGTPQKNVHA